MTDAIWTEKYRPQKFSDIKGQQEIVARVQAFVEQKNMPHLLFTGPPGVGKTSLSLVIVKTLFGESWRNNFLELNASDERGIDVIRNKVKDFARTRAIGDVPFKIIYLDECDALTKEAQQALRRTMENYTQTTRFILSANYSSKILDPIQSRCAIFKFRPLAQDDIYAILNHVVAKEMLLLDDQAREALFKVSEGDCRRLENVLQSCASLGKNITADMVFSIASVAEPKEITDALQLAIAGKFVESRKKLLDVMMQYGLSGLDAIKQIQKQVWKLDINGKDKVMLIDKCGEIEFRLVEGADEFVQLEALLAFFTLTGATAPQNS